ncbi:MAG: 50S ribosomal protein L25 [Desulfobulbaceae bacterium]|nr:MAG: 50S ribosomal protein L25 [Desulfobulbaceae bacterium]
MLQIDIAASKRDNRGKGAARGLRRAGRTPAILYGPEIASQALSLDTLDLTKALLSVHRRNSVINLEVTDEQGKAIHHVLTREIQVDPIDNHLLHADFLVISLEESMVFQVPLRYTGKAKGVDMGGELEVLLKKVSLKGKPLNIPDDLAIDISPLGPNTKLTCEELSLPTGVELVEDKNAVCVVVVGGTE